MTTQTNHIRIFDTTLRDGEQSPGATLNFSEKLEIARQLEALGVDVIEAGFPITSPGDFEAVSAIAKELSKPIVAGLARAVPADVERAGRAVQHARRGRIHVFCATSKIHREKKLRKAFDEIIKISVEQVKHAREFVEDVEFSPEDGSRTELDYLVEITGAVIDAGATTVNIPDTVGYAMPEEYGRIFSFVREKLPIIDQNGIVLSAHCHDDLGLATANSLAAVRGGARQIECTINGIGERAGNASLEEIVMAIRTRGDYWKISTNVDPRKIYATSRMVSQLTGLYVQRNKAIVGENAFAHESGIHQDGVIKDRETYEIIDPREVGIPENKLVLGKHSGRAALKQRLEELGYTVDDITLSNIYENFKKLSDKKKNVYDEDIEALIESELESSGTAPGAAANLWTLTKLQFTSGSGSGAIPTATVELTDSAGTSVLKACTGDGPVDAIYAAMQEITGVQATLLDYALRAVSQGRDAQGEVQVEIEHSGRRVRGRGVSTDVIEASALAYLAGLNRIRTLDRRAEQGRHTDQP
ncbi:MAG: 2-isopropylmalate synthase [Phycisphaeraceae bacterium]